MQVRKVFLMASIAFLVISSATITAAGDFDWVENFNIRADADPSGFRARLAARFRVADTQVEVILGKVRTPAEGYILFRLGEIAERPPDYVLRRYKTDKGKGWGSLAKSLGIKPGSKEFHALKRGDDLYDGTGRGGSSGGNRTKGKGKGKHKD
jgi:hypothetical protein